MISSLYLLLLVIQNKCSLLTRIASYFVAYKMAFFTVFGCLDSIAQTAPAIDYYCSVVVPLVPNADLTSPPRQLKDESI